MKKYLFYIVILLPVYFSCSNKENCKAKHRNKITKFNDTHQLLRVYDNCNNIEVEMLIKDSIRDGYAKDYYTDGAIKSSRFYKNDVLDSTYIYYYENGNIKEKRFYRDGNIYGIPTEYYNNGTIKTLKYLRFGTKEYWLTLNYNAKGQIDSFDGNLFTVYSTKEWTQIKLNDSLLVGLEVPQMNDIQTYLIFKKYRNDELYMDTTISNFDSIDNHFVFMTNEEIVKNGNYRYQWEVKLADSNNKVLISDTGSREFRIAQ